MAPSSVSWNKHLGMVGEGRGRSHTRVHKCTHTFQREEEAGRALRRALSSREEEEEEPAESGGC